MGNYLLAKVRGPVSWSWDTWLADDAGFLVHDGHHHRSPFNDTATLGAHPSVDGVVRGRFEEVLRSETLPAGGGQSIREEMWRFRVTAPVAGPAGEEAHVLLRMESIEPDGRKTLMPFPVTPRPGEDVILFVTKRTGSGRPVQDLYAPLVLGPGVTGVIPVSPEGIVTVMEGGQRVTLQADAFLSHVRAYMDAYRPSMASSDAVQRIRETAERFRGVAQAIGEYGDHFLDPATETLWVYLADVADEGTVRQAVEAAFPEGTRPRSGIQFVRPLAIQGVRDTLYSRVQGAVLAIDAAGPNSVFGWSKDGGRWKRIRFDVATPYTAWRARRALDAAGLPQEIVRFGVRKPYTVNTPPALERLDNGLAIRIEAPTVVTAGTPVALALVFSNQSGATLAFDHGRPWYEDIALFDIAGEEVWSKYRGEGMIGTGWTTRLLPGEEVRVETTWPGQDQDGFPVPSGDYWLRGWHAVSTVLDGRHHRYTLATPLVPVRVNGP